MTCDVPAPSQRRKRGKSSRVALLEQKIDGIMSLLAEKQHGQRPVLPTEPPRSTGSGNQALFRLIPDFQVTAGEASRFLSMYASEYAPNFPFVMVPSAATAHSLHDRSPGLFWAIMTAVAPQSFAVQQRVKTWFRQYVADHVIVRQEKTLQLLQAILVHLAWGDFHFYINAEATNLPHLALALATDLRLDKSPESSAATIRSRLGEAWTALHHGGPSRLGIPHTLDDQRAVLGLYHLSSLISALFKRGPRFPWTPYLSQCCDALTNAREHPSDALLVARLPRRAALHAPQPPVPPAADALRRPRLHRRDSQPPAGYYSSTPRPTGSPTRPGPSSSSQRPSRGSRTTLPRADKWAAENARRRRRKLMEDGGAENNP
ncbi:Fungal transcriptional regulatory protein, partial [Metarhizium majus ARSEF 297]